MPHILPKMDTGAISGTLLKIFIVLVIVGLLVTLTWGGFVVWVLVAAILVIIAYGILARWYYRWIGRR